MKRKESANILYGRHPVTDAIRAGQQFDKLLLQQGTRGEFEKEIRHLSKQFQIPVTTVPKEKLNKLTRNNHQGIIGYISLIKYYDLEDVLPTLYEQENGPLMLILDGVTDVRNFGAIARTAELTGVGGIIVPLKGSALINAEAMKASAGALSKIPICRVGSLNNAVEYLQQSGVQVVTSSLKAKSSVRGLDFKIPTAIVIGSEGEGVSNHMIKKANETFIIPQVGTTDSFNVSVATGMILYEAMTQRLEHDN